jgi:hypothetical protein
LESTFKAYIFFNIFEDSLSLKYINGTKFEYRYYIPISLEVKINAMLKYIQIKSTYILLVYMVLIALSCSTSKNNTTIKDRSKQPNWVQQRPVDNKYYVGVGYANKTLNPADFQSMAKKRALNDMIGEIKVVVSTNSILSQYQNNNTLNQIFATDTKVNAQAMVEDFEVVDSWENKTDFYIYYKLSKAEYEATKRRKLQAAIEQSINFLDNADRLSYQNNYMQIIRLRIKALSALQNYLNEDVATFYKGNEVYLVNEIVNQIQNQLYQLQVKTDVVELKGKIGKPINNPFTAYVKFTENNTFVPFVPLTLKATQAKFDFGNSAETDQNGMATFSLNRIQAKDPIQQVKIMVDIATIIKSDSLNGLLKSILTNIDAPSTNFRLVVEPIKIFTNSKEQILSKNIEFNIIEPQLKRKLVESGCNFVTNRTQADYEIKVIANTTDLGILWGKMLQANINMDISIVDVKNNQEIYKDALKDIKGFQLTPENASRDAYNNMLSKFWEQVYPTFMNELLLTDH